MVKGISATALFICKSQIASRPKKMAKNNIIACTNPYWHYYSPIYYNELEKPFLGEARAKAEYPMKTLLDAGG